MKLNVPILYFGLVFIANCYALSSMCMSCLKSGHCRPPSCFCCRDAMGLSMPIREIPQIVFFTFDDALTDMAARFYNRLFDSSRKNPNGCPISMTMFISHSDTKYRHVSDFHKKGMEIAAHSVTHSHMKPDNFYTEAKNQKRNLAKYGNFSESDIVGWRSPFLEPVGDLQPEKLKQLGYKYDATLTFSKRKLNDSAPTPFTLDFGWPFDCKVKPCPRGRHSGFWEVPVVSLLDYRHQYDCVYVDGCMNIPPDEETAFKFLMDNFNSYYNSERIPFGINMHPSWFYTDERLSAMDRFIKQLVKMDDVFIVSVKKTLDWLQNPTPLSSINSFTPWQCDGALRSLVKNRSRNIHKSSNKFQRQKRPNYYRNAGPLVSHYIFSNPQISEVPHSFTNHEIPQPPSILKTPSSNRLDREQVLRRKQIESRLANNREIQRQRDQIKKEKIETELSWKMSSSPSSFSSSSNFNKLPSSDAASRQLSNLQNPPERKTQDKNHVVTPVTWRETPTKEFKIPFSRHSKTWGKPNTKTTRQRIPVFQKPRFEFQHKLPMAVKNLSNNAVKSNVKKERSRTRFTWNYRIPKKEKETLLDEKFNYNKEKQLKPNIKSERNINNQNLRQVQDKNERKRVTETQQSGQNRDKHWSRFVRMMMGNIP